jgi:hypothetical protein
MRKITKRSIAITTAAVVAVGGGAAAWAAWTVSGSATASANAGSAVPVTVVNAGLIGPLIPGPGTGVKFRVENPNAFTVRVSGATLGAFASARESCPSDNFVAGPGSMVGTVDIPAGNGADIGWNNAVKLKASPDDACQGAPLTFSVNVTAASID